MNRTIIPTEKREILDTVACLFTQIKLLEEDVIVCGQYNLYAEAMQFEHHIYQSTHQRRIEICLWLIPKKY